MEITDNMKELLDGVKKVVGVEEYLHFSVPENDFEQWLTEKDSMGVFVVVDKSGNISVYGTYDNNNKLYLTVDSLEDFKLDYNAVRMMAIIETHPEEVQENRITTGIELQEWIWENDALLSLDTGEANAVMEVFLETGYGLYFDANGGLYMDKCKGDEHCAVKICVDDVIDYASEQSYEKIHALKKELEKVPSEKDMNHYKDDIPKILDKFTELMRLEMKNRSIVSAYTKTTYGNRYYYGNQYEFVPAHKLGKTRK